MEELIDNLGTPPDPVIPLGVGGMIGFSLLLLLSAALVVAPAALGRYDFAMPHLVVTVLGGLALTAAELRFFRAIGPENQGGTIALWIAIIAIPLVLAVALGLFDRASLAGAGALAVTGIGAAVLAGLIDKLLEHLSAIPLSILGALALVALVGVFATSSRR